VENQTNKMTKNLEDVRLPVNCVH